MLDPLHEWVQTSAADPPRVGYVVNSQITDTRSCCPPWCPPCA